MQESERYWHDSQARHTKSAIILPRNNKHYPHSFQHSMHYRSPLRNIFLSIGSFFVAILWNSFIIPLHAQTPTPGAGNLSAQAALPQSSITLTPAQVTANRDTIITIDISGYTLLATDTARAFIGGVEVPTNTITNKRVSIRVTASRIPVAGGYTVTLRIFNGQVFTLGTAALTGVLGTTGAGDKRRIYWLHGLNSEEEDWFAINSAEWVTTMPPPNDPNYATLLPKYNLWNSLFSQNNVGYKNYIDKIAFSDKSEGITIRYPTKRFTTRSLQERYGVTDPNDVPTIPEAAQKMVSLDMNLPVAGQPLPIAIGHSMGGLVLRSIARQIESTQATQRFGGIITIGTPNNGAALVSGIMNRPRNAAAVLQGNPAFRSLAVNGVSVAGEQASLAIKELGAGPGFTLLTSPFTPAGAIGSGAITAALVLAATNCNDPIGTIFTSGVVGIFGGTVYSLPGVVSAIAGGALTLNSLIPSFIPQNLFGYQSAISKGINDGFTINRPNVLDMYVEPDGRGGGTNASPFLQDLNSPLPSARPLVDRLNPVPVINIWGNTTEHEAYSIATANFSTRKQDGITTLLCEQAPNKPQYLPITDRGEASDKFIPDLVMGKVKPLYIGFSAYYGVRGTIDALVGNWVGAAIHAFGVIQYIRGWSFLDAGADIAYRKVIGAYKKEPLINFSIFGFQISLGEKEVRVDSDAFIPAWSQKSNGATLQIVANQVNHGLMANHPNMTANFRTIFNSGLREFELK